ncbi:dihydroorotate dehydrogenase [Chelativorans sp. Marseille-P2723]|uniref:dihydroorotate dehydrogenase n=1 Tax=Chelativorans sp. Marseille-P2723 TaxID=2709133 RepID=UPI0015714961|nr:dihydroorotate dehydrogenase [Chelativorans sp. Marseille-P2723]
MTIDLSVSVGGIRLKNPVIAGAAEHLIHAEGIRAALSTGVGAVVVKSNNEVEASKDQLERSEYTLLDEHWRQVPWNDAAPRSVTLACRSGMSPLPFDQWLEQAVRLDREAKKQDAYVIASLILGALEPAVAMARQIEQAGIRVMEFNVGVPYGSQTAKGNVATELSTEGIREQVSAIRSAVSIPVWVKTSGQSERVPALAGAAFESGADAVIMAGRLLGFLPDPETQKPLFGTSLGVGGFWHLPITCHWLAMTRKALGPDRPLIGINGAQTGSDVLRMMLAGASAVEIASSIMYAGFPALARAVEEVSGYFIDRGENAAAIIGRAADEHRTFMQMPRGDGNWRNYVPADALPASEG